jgi:proteasome lid subunit RPN8/RPN11
MDRLEIFKNIDLQQLADIANDYREVVMVWNFEGELRLVSNISTQDNTFAIDYGTKEAIKDGYVTGILHSHLPHMLPDLSKEDIVFADFYRVDIASYHISGKIDFFSPFLHHPYPLVARLDTFQDRRYEEYRSDCYRFIENCLSYAGYQLPKYPRSQKLYQFDENFQLGKLASESGWVLLTENMDYLDLVRHGIDDGCLIVLNYNTDSHHFGLYIDGSVVTFTLKGVRCHSHRIITKYATHVYRLINPLSPQQKTKLREILSYFGI